MEADDRRAGDVGAVPPRRADSGTMRRVLGSTRAVLVAGRALAVGVWLDFGRPRAAAAQERRVDRLARRAASWSAWWEGEMML